MAMREDELHLHSPESPPGLNPDLIDGEAPERAFFIVESDQGPDPENLVAGIDKFETPAQLIVEVLAQMGLTEATAEHNARKEQLRSLLSKNGINSSDLWLMQQLEASLAPRMAIEAQVSDMSAQYYEYFFGGDGSRITDKVESEIFEPSEDFEDTMFLRTMIGVRRSLKGHEKHSGKKKAAAANLAVEAEHIARLLVNVEVAETA